MMDKIDGLTLDLETANKAKLRAVFPECFTEDRLDIDKLLSLCGDYITDDFEKYEFRWKGKSECLRLAQKRSTATLRPVPEDSVNWDTTQNLYIEGDNLEVLKLLQKSYFRKVKMIYIDPPYNTGNDFVYADDFADPLARYKEVTAQTTKSNPETMGRYHTNWLNMMYPRLRLAANLLRDDGVIFISIDDNEVANLRKLCDEVFGEENFIACLIWEKTRKNDARFFSCGHEYIVVYVKSESYLREQNIYWREDKPGAKEIFAEYEALRKKYGDDFAAMETELREYYANLPKEHPAKKHSRYNKVDERGVWRDDNMSWPGGGGPRYDVIHPVTGLPCKVPPSGWRYPTLQRMLEMIEGGYVIFREDHTEPPIKKSYLVRKVGRLSKEESVGMQVMGTYFYRSALQATNELADLIGPRIFEYPKDQEVLRRFISYVSSQDDNDIILDFFSGSATTAHAIMQLNAEDGGNRRFIMVQLPEICDEKSEAAKNGYPNICEIGKERIRRAGKKIAESGKDMDVGFKVFRLDSSNIKTWDDTPIDSGDLNEVYARMDTAVENLKLDRSDMDLVYEILLKLGYSLTAELTVQEVDGLSVYTVEQAGLGKMLICLQPGVTAEIVEKLAALAPQTIVLAEKALADNSAMSNAHYLLKNRGIELKIV